MTEYGQRYAYMPSPPVYYYSDAPPTEAGDDDDVPSIPPVMTFPESESDDDLDISVRLNGACKAVDGARHGYQTYTSSRSLGIVNKSGDMLGAINTDVTNLQGSSLTSPLKSAYESEAMQTIRNGVNALADHLPGLIKALDEVAKLHPFIGVAVGAFRIVVELDLKRRDNDKKIASLFLEMKDMMEALLQLRSIKDQEAIGPGGMTIKARMQGLVQQTADDITSCGNACDTYSKKKLIVKVIKSSVWDSTLKGYIDLFAKRRKDFTFALAIHTGAGVDDANRKLNALDSKMDLLLEFFANAVSPEQRELAALVQKKGGPAAVVGKEETLKELLNFKPSSLAASVKRRERDGPEHLMQVQVKTKASVRPETIDTKDLVRELAESPEVAMKNNFEVFERKFKMQQRELAEEMSRMVHHEGDRVIEAVTSGPHDRIIDPDIHEIWREMRWPGHVKARHFVLALRDYYRHQIDSEQRNPEHKLITNVSREDQWALEWINISRLQAIAEAFDDDASGFITIAEVNQFTSTRPQGWSLPHWLAYWAIGWNMTAMYYREKIIDILTKMLAMRPLILEANREFVRAYLEKIYERVCNLVYSLVGEEQPESLKARFQSYVDAEEERLRQGLETVKYDIDGMDTLTLIIGPGRIEKSLFPLLYLLMKRDFEIFRACQKVVAHKLELWDSADSIVWVFDAVTYRHNELEALFKQQKLNPEQQFKIHADELFDYWHDSKTFWSLPELRVREFPEIEYVEDQEDQQSDIREFLNYPSPADEIYQVSEDSLTDDDSQADDAVKMILGRWHGFFGAERWPFAPMLSFCWHASTDHITYHASALTAAGTRYTINGGYEVKEDGSIQYNFSRVHALSSLRTTYFTGVLDEDGGRLSGSWGYEEDDKPYPFLFFKHLSPDYIIARPPPAAFDENRVRALWRYALTAVRNEVRRKMLSWSVIQERRRIKEEYFELLRREEDDTLTSGDLDRFAVLDGTNTYDDIRSFYVLNDYRQAPVLWHYGVICDACGDRLCGARWICLKCGSKFTFDFCDKPACRGETVPRDDVTEPHLPTHDFVKVRRFLHQYLEIGKLLRTADAGLEHARFLLQKTASIEEGKTASQDAETPPTNEVKAIRRPREEVAVADSHSEGDEDVLPTCVSCSASVSYPCWFCIDCPADSNVFICADCDEKKGGFDLGQHERTHSLVYCTEKADEEDEEENTAEQRLSAVENKLAMLTTQMERIEKLLESLTISRST
ncbi:hypothetical protein BD414DRAFT_497057 [Trametes punicea]|nr:hypothetical protein BD414DRAFT_497057 [Trametes punicea]